MNQEQICIKRAHNICTFDRDIAENFGLEEAVFVMYLQQSIDTAFEIKRHKPEEVELIVKDGLVEAVDSRSIIPRDTVLDSKTNPQNQR